MGSEAVDAIIKSRLVELRWTRAVSDDGYSILEGQGDFRFERPRIVAMTPVLRKAMEIVLREEGEMEETRDIKGERVNGEGGEV
jgi:TRAP-type uncharacterized transport system substrate-binding protein